MKQPRTVRNFWVEVVIDGQATKLTGGPKSEDGGIMLRVYQRENGTVSEVLNVSGCAMDNGDLLLSVDTRGEVLPAKVRTKR